MLQFLYEVSMNLRDYLIEKGITQARFAEKLGITRHYLAHIISGRYIPGKLLADTIKRLTKGAVVYTKREKDGNG